LAVVDSTPATEHDALHESYLQQVQHILASNTFKVSATLQQLLEFLAERSVLGNAAEIKEYTIGIEALGRKQDFDPKTDPIVRVQMHRLRQKLREYYDSEGRGDSVLVDLPRGHYVLRFVVLPTPRASGSSFEALVEPERGEMPPAGHKFEAETLPLGSRLRVGRWFSNWAATGSLGLLCFLLGAGTSWHFLARQPARNSARPAPSAEPVTNFWNSLLASDPKPIISYADAVFLLDNSNDLFRYRSGPVAPRGALVDPYLARQDASDPFLAAQAGPLYYENGYTGTGELQAVARLVQLLTRMGKVPTILSSREITADDLQQHTVIFLGSPSQNPAVAQLPANGDLRFEAPAPDHEIWGESIVSLHPTSGQAAEYQTERDPGTGVLKSDFGLFSVQPGILPGHFLIVMAGLDTTGTEGSAQYATSISGVEELSRALTGAGIGGDKRFTLGFQALLCVHLENGYQVLDTSLVGVHPLPSPPSGH
jgi:hypothetical protein